MSLKHIKIIGEGGLGIVSLHKAADGQEFAVKRMKYVWDPNLFGRFKREINIMANLVHKNIVKVLNHDTDNDNPYYVMPYFKDGSLRDKMKLLQAEGKVYDVGSASAIIYYLADALVHAHSKMIIHRDLKPENILFDGHEPMIADWGVGKFIHRESQVITKAGIGTRTYCAPEQWENGLSDHRSDIYSLGIIFRELLTGSTHGKISDFKVDQIIEKMTKASPADRYQTMIEVMEAINSLEIVNTADPMTEFWDGAAKIALGVSVIYLVSKLFQR